jgi:hypothetical protein
MRRFAWTPWISTMIKTISAGQVAELAYFETSNTIRDMT